MVPRHTEASPSRRAVLGTAWAAPVLLASVTVPSAAASTSTGSLSYTWSVFSPGPIPQPPLWSRFVVTNSTASAVSVVFRAVRAQGGVVLTSVTQASGWTPVEPSVPAVFERAATVAAGSTRQMLLGFDGASGQTQLFEATLTPSAGAALEPTFLVAIP